MAQTIIVDISTRGANPVAYTHQGDTGRTFFAEIYENGEAFAVAGYTIKVGAILPADRGYYVIAGNDMVTATKTTDGTNKIYFTLSDKYSLKAGNGILTLIFTSNTGTPSTIRPINIDLRIQKSADADDTIAGASDFPEGLESIAESVFQEYLSTYLPPVAPSASAAANKAADAKLTGEALDDLKSDLNYYHTAEPGYVLRATDNGHGNEWAMVGTPTDAQAETAINAWLDAHPEATTTVQDWSLTYKKLVKGTLGFVTPQMYGAKADGVTDDTASIQAAIDSGKTVLVPNGTYIVDPDTGIQIRSGTRMILGPNAIIQASASSSGTYYIVYILDCDDVVISGGKIIGEKDIHTGSGGEWGHGINIETSNNVLIENVEVANCWGDGIYVGCKFVDNESIGFYRSTNVTIQNVLIHDCRRNGISPVGCIGLNILDSEIFNISGTNPQAGIDFEVNNDDYPTENINVHNAYIHDCQNQELIIPRAVKNAIISDSFFDGTVRIETGENVIVDNCYMELLDVDGIDGNERVFNNCIINNAVTIGQTNSYGLVFNNCKLGSDKTPKVNVPVMATSARTEDVANRCSLELNNCTLKNDTVRNIFSFSRSVRSVAIINCNLISARTRIAISASTELLIKSTRIDGANNALDLICPEVTMVENLFGNKMLTAYYGYLIQFETATTINFIGNTLLGNKIETQFLRANYGKNPSGIIANNVIPQYATVGSLDSGNTLKIANNVLAGTTSN